MVTSPTTAECSVVWYGVLVVCSLQFAFVVVFVVHVVVVVV